MIDFCNQFNNTLSDKQTRNLYLHEDPCKSYILAKDVKLKASPINTYDVLPKNFVFTILQIFLGSNAAIGIFKAIDCLVQYLTYKKSQNLSLEAEFFFNQLKVKICDNPQEIDEISSQEAQLYYTLYTQIIEGKTKITIYGSEKFEKRAKTIIYDLLRRPSGREVLLLTVRLNESVVIQEGKSFGCLHSSPTKIFIPMISQQTSFIVQTADGTQIFDKERQDSVSLGHELIHFIHRKMFTQAEDGKKLHDKFEKLRPGLFSKYEERITIASSLMVSENVLRKEFGLLPRVAHLAGSESSLAQNPSYQLKNPKNFLYQAVVVGLDAEIRAFLAQGCHQETAENLYQEADKAQNLDVILVMARAGFKPVKTSEENWLQHIKMIEAKKAATH